MPGEFLYRQDLVFPDLLQELVDQRQVGGQRRVLVPALGVIVHEGCVVLDAVVTREVVEAECAALPEQCDAPDDQDVRKRARETVALLEGFGDDGGSELLSIMWPRSACELAVVTPHSDG